MATKSSKILLGHMSRPNHEKKPSFRQTPPPPSSGLHSVISLDMEVSPWGRYGPLCVTYLSSSEKQQAEKLKQNKSLAPPYCSHWLPPRHATVSGQVRTTGDIRGARSCQVRDVVEVVVVPEKNVSSDPGVADGPKGFG